MGSNDLLGLWLAFFWRSKGLLQTSRGFCSLQLEKQDGIGKRTSNRDPAREKAREPFQSREWHILPGRETERDTGYQILGAASGLSVDPTGSFRDADRIRSLKV